MPSPVCLSSGAKGFGWGAALIYGGGTWVREACRGTLRASCLKQMVCLGEYDPWAPVEIANYSSICSSTVGDLAEIWGCFLGLEKPLYSYTHTATLGEPQKLERTRKDGMNRPPRFGRARGGIGARPWSHRAPAGVWDRHAVWDRRAAVSERAGGMRAPARRYETATAHSRSAL